LSRRQSNRILALLLFVATVAASGLARAEIWRCEDG
jgi:hypothetical protein